MSEPNSPATFPAQLQEPCFICAGKRRVRFSNSLEDCPKCMPDPNPKDMLYRVEYTEGPFNTDWFKRRYFRFHFTAWLFAKGWVLTHSLGSAYVQKRRL